MLLTREMCWRAYAEASPSVRLDLRPLQLGLGRCPWRVAVASMLLARSRPERARVILGRLLSVVPTPMHLASAQLEDVQACGLRRNLARRLQRFSVEWLGERWTDLRELTGAGESVADCVATFCFNRP